MVWDWIIEKMQTLKEEPNLILIDSLRLLSEYYGDVHRFANENGFTVIIASTNLIFRELYEKATATNETIKILLIDSVPERRRTEASLSKAPPLLYPDLLSKTAHHARIEISLRRILIDHTGDPDWPQVVNEPIYSKMITRSIDGVIQAHKNLRAAHSTRFTDHDIRTILAYSKLNIPEAAFKLPNGRIYWRIAIASHSATEELDTVAPELATFIRDELRNMPSPYCELVDSPQEMVARALFLSAILSQHFEHWKLMLANMGMNLKGVKEMDRTTIQEIVLDLISIDPMMASRHILDLEKSLSKEQLHFIFLEQMKLLEDGCFADVIEREHYSTFISSLALLTGLDSLLSNGAPVHAHKKLYQLLFSDANDRSDRLIEERGTEVWANLKETYRLVWIIREIRDALDAGIKYLSVQQTARLSFLWFRTLWNDHRVNRLEYYLSALDRIVGNTELLPQSLAGLPSAFTDMQKNVRKQVAAMKKEIHQSLSTLNLRFQEMVSNQYPSWVAKEDEEVRLTSQFLRRCLKPHWDLQSERAMVFVFDGMRYDIWEELVKPIFEEHMEIISDDPASSLLPSETHISRKAIFAGDFPDSFDMRRGEDVLLKEALQRDFAYNGDVEVVNPVGSGTGETVRYRAGNVEFIIFDLCDKELHKIPMKTLPDGSSVADRPLSFVYEQHIKNIIDHEVMAIVRGLAPGTKVFVVADHGFVTVGREQIWLEASWLNEPKDCRYLNALIKKTLQELRAPRKVLKCVWEFSVLDLRLPVSISNKDFKSILFPKTGYALARPHGPFKPDAYSHGGISIQEMLVPMVVMRVKTAEEGLLVIGSISGPSELIEGEKAEFRLPVRLSEGLRSRELRVVAEADYPHKDSTPPLHSKKEYLSASQREIVFRFTPDPSDASEEEQKNGLMERTLRIDLTYYADMHTFHEIRTKTFSVRLNSQKIIRRVPPQLGKILGMTPKGMR